MKPTDQQLLESFSSPSTHNALIREAGGLERYWSDCNDGVLLLTLAVNLRLFGETQRRSIACWAIRNLPYDAAGCMTFADVIEGSLPGEILSVAEAHTQGFVPDATLAVASKGLGSYVFKTMGGDHDAAQIGYAVFCAATPKLANLNSDRTALSALFLVKQEVPTRSALFAKELRRRMSPVAFKKEMDTVRARLSAGTVKTTSGEELL